MFVFAQYERCSKFMSQRSTVFQLFFWKPDSAGRGSQLRDRSSALLLLLRALRPEGPEPGVPAGLPNGHCRRGGVGQELAAVRHPRQHEEDGGVRGQGGQGGLRAAAGE